LKYLSCFKEEDSNSNIGALHSLQILKRDSFFLASFVLFLGVFDVVDVNLAIILRFSSVKAAILSLTPKYDVVAQDSHSTAFGGSSKLIKLKLTVRYLFHFPNRLGIRPIPRLWLYSGYLGQCPSYLG
jgi:hypothetical protein